MKNYRSPVLMTSAISKWSRRRSNTSINWPHVELKSLSYAFARILNARTQNPNTPRPTKTAASQHNFPRQYHRGDYNCGASLIALFFLWSLASPEGRKFKTGL